MQRIVIFCFLMFLSFGCKNISSNEKMIDDADSFMITLSIIVKEKDVIEIFYINSKDEIRFSEEKKIRKSVEGTNDVQTISFKLPIEALSNSFRIDLGNNKKQNILVRIKNITFKSKQGELTIEGNEMEWFFTVNKYLMHKGNGQYQIIEMDGRADPFIVSKPILNKKLEIEL